ncbi:hypothetical protein ACFZA1_04765 [Streptomyces filipinensis]|uniref:hypothetical protein n=1 Tax=Streptomyces filipinensis TaxID=66887 RepID=UPI0036EF6505
MRRAQSRMDRALVSGAAVLLISSHTRPNCSALIVGLLAGCAMVRSSWMNGPFHPLFQKALSTARWQPERAGAQAIGQRRSDSAGQRLALQFDRFGTGS